MSQSLQLNNWLHTCYPEGAAGLDLDITALTSIIQGREGRHPQIWHTLTERLKNLPKVDSICSDLSAPVINVVSKDPSQGADLVPALTEFAHSLDPWRKGPFNLFGLDIEGEWRSDLKWQRILPVLRSLSDQSVLDIGASSGYYMYRMAALKPRCVLGIDPDWRLRLQFEFIQKYARTPGLYYLSAGMEDLIHLPGCFDTIFCMGILYHRRSPIDALDVLRHCLKPGGRLIVETLVLDQEGEYSLTPSTTYAKMRNVYFIPTPSALVNWLKRAHFKEASIIDITKTTKEEQRNTAFCLPPLQTLEHFLHPGNASLTTEGHPAPTRAMAVARC